jgi:hypothetical protein
MRAVRLTFLAAFGGTLLCSGAFASPLPVPPVPPDQLPSISAPVPDKQAAPPMVIAQDEGVRITPQNYRNTGHSGDPASGYLPGSNYQDSEDQKGLQTPGFLVTVPLTHPHQVLPPP